MQIPLQLTMRNMADSPELTRRIRHRVSTLDRFQAMVTACRVSVTSAEPPDGYTATVELRLPGGISVSSEEKGEDAYGAFRDALAAATEQLERLPPRKREVA